MLALVLAACSGCRPDPLPAAGGSASPAGSPATARDGKVKLFKDDVVGGTLPLSIEIETVGGVSLVLIPRGTPLPARVTDTFSTAADGQSSVELHMILGERPRAQDNLDPGRFELTGIPPARTGMPRIEVSFEVDRAGALTVSAIDGSTKASRAFRFDGVAGPALDQRTVGRMLAEANASQLEDSRARLDNRIYQSRRTT